MTQEVRPHTLSRSGHHREEYYRTYEDEYVSIHSGGITLLTQGDNITHSGGITLLYVCAHVCLPLAASRITTKNRVGLFCHHSLSSCILSAKRFIG